MPYHRQGHRRRNKGPGILSALIERLEERQMLSAVSLVPVADTTINSQSPNSTAGSTGTLEADGSPDKAALLKWDVSGIAPGSKVTGASLTVTVSNGSPSGYQIYELLAPFSEASTTWNNAPTRSADVLGTIVAPNVGQAYTVQLTVAGLAAVQRWIDDPDSNNGVIIFNSSNSNGLDIYSRESSTASRRPMLNVTLEDAPDPDPDPEPDPEPDPDPIPTGDGLWISRSEIMALPTSGTAWSTLNSYANQSAGTANVSNQESNHDVLILAKALVGVRTNNAAMIEQARQGILSAIGTERGGRTLALARNIPAYVAAADIIGLSGADKAAFSNWLSAVRTENLDGKTLISTHEDRPNNWGTHAGAARVAIDLYIGDDVDLSRAIKVFKGWLGDRSQYAGFSWGDLSWQSNRSAPVGINPKGATISGHNVDGVLPDDQRRGGSFRWPAPQENYVYEALQGTIVTAELLYRAGYTDVYQWSDAAILRAYTWLYNVNSYPAAGDDRWQMWIVNKRYGTIFATSASASPGKNMGWTAWTSG